jgi:hypothetical protein
MVFVRYTGGDRAVGYWREIGIRFVLDTSELIFTNPVTTPEEEIS